MAIPNAIIMNACLLSDFDLSCTLCSLVLKEENKLASLPPMLVLFPSHSFCKSRTGFSTAMYCSSQTLSSWH